MATILIYGNCDAKMIALKNNLDEALLQFPLSGKVEEISDDNKIMMLGAHTLPALVVDGEVLAEGAVPSVDELRSLLRNRQLLRSKLYQMKKILVPVDLSPASENALRYACMMAHTFGASVEVVYAMDSIFEGTKPSPSGFLSGYKKTMQEELDNFVKNTLSKKENHGCPDWGATELHQQFGTDSARLRTRIVFGFPEEMIAQMSDHADLVVMGTTGRGNLTRKLFGSVSIALSQTAKCPVLLIPSQAVFSSFKNILYASNFESLDALAIKQTVTFTRRFEGQLHFVHVGPAAENGVELEKKLFEINYIYADPEHPFIFSKIVGEEVVESLHEYAFEHAIDLFIFVTHNRSFWESILHRSISREMLLNTTAPVMVIHAEEDLLGERDKPA